MKTTASKIALLFVCFTTIFLGCTTSFEADYGRQILRVNEDLSGTFTRGIAFSDYDWNQAAFYYFVDDPTNRIAQEVANNMKWNSFEHTSVYVEEYHWVDVTTKFDSPATLYTLISAVTSDTDSGSGGSGRESDLPDYSITKDEGFFRTQYHLQGTLIALGATGAAQEATYYAHLPGEIVETNGRTLDDNMVAWDWGYYDYVPYNLSTQSLNTINISIAAVIVAGGLAGLIVMGIMKRKQQKEPEDLGIKDCEFVALSKK